MRYFFAGALSKLIATVSTYPLLTLKTCLQAKKEDMSFVGSLKQLLKEEGILGFYKGIQAKLL